MMRRVLLLGLITTLRRGIPVLPAQGAEPRAFVADRDCAGNPRSRSRPKSTRALISIAVKPGQEIHKGDVLAVLDSPELSASVDQTKAAEEQARADRNNVYAGVRKEEIDIATHNVEIAKSNVGLALQQYDRTAALAASNYTSQQKLDEADATLKKGQGHSRAA